MLVEVDLDRCDAKLFTPAKKSLPSNRTREGIARRDGHVNQPRRARTFITRPERSLHHL